MSKQFFKTVCIFFILQLLAVTSVSAAVPVNDELGNATIIGAFPFTDTVLAADSDDATSEADELECSSGFYNGTWWYSVTLSESGELTADAMSLNPALILPTDMSNQTAVNVAIYSGTTHPLTELACEGSFVRVPDPSDPGYTMVDITQSIINPTVTALVPAGTYYILVGNSTNTSTVGDIRVNVAFTPAALPAPIAENIPVNNPLALLLLILGLFSITLMKKRNQ
ncbi:hypothetical protein OO007_12620 [Cocleimonas sp. KMM 6892]|uniref:hypothetical protein n=1 Tax=unclassified Cocleimonas TaxID=2639732 RepID=UPI002DB9D0DC|nr:MULTISPECIES: hypothetical protein [unclassified Cocleimonas]MEB8433074.1 hypothetical protein [Cocleimonas sp. KMM 6892]MEC4715945.1 hypothetical protein [Cocleimonas sp. KMM 6895]MEC4745406.1 hypothetical protein [Cocleimonas sp. KMM 6896]